MKMKVITLKRYGLVVLGVIGLAVSAQSALISLNSTNYFQNFDFPALAKMGDKNSSMPLGWTFTETKVKDNTYIADNGQMINGGIHSYGAAGSNDRALGSLR